MMSDVLEELVQEMSTNGLFVPDTSITIQNVVGEGEFGVVYKALLHGWKENMHSLVAVKTLKGMFSCCDVKHLAEESQIMARFDHPNVMKLIGVSMNKYKHLFIVMPFMAKGSLLYHLKKNRHIFTIESEEITEMPEVTSSRLLSMCLQIAKGMEYLAHNKFVHRDLAARNCMIDLNNVIKVADFGLTEDTYARNYFRQTTEQEDGEPPVKLPVKWMALESLNDGIFSEKTDVWSFGVTCWEVFSLGKNPYPGVDPFSLIRYLERGERLDKPLNAACSQEIYNVMRECWEWKPWKRPSFSQLVTVISTSLEGMGWISGPQLSSSYHYKYSQLT
ncbi:Tyrosine-protein kinase transforming protein SEA [Geodia barretti]|nr:Tyrosine-protein kinase transforming protein SEA [Geodia barretti]